MNIDERAVSTIRIISAEAVQKANSGHPGLPMGAAAIGYALWGYAMNHNPKDPKWINRDRFILSAGHGSALLYSLLHLFNYGISIDDLKNFRKLGSNTPGHPEYGHTVGVETTTGPLGQGVANGVGMAIAESYLAKYFNRNDFDVIDHYTFVLAGDGCMMEGISSEAASLAGTLKLKKLILIYDSNNITIEGKTDIAFKEDVGKRYEAYGWNVIRVEDGNDYVEILKAVENAKKSEEKPTLIIANTIIGYGCKEKQGTSGVHGEPLGELELQKTKQYLGFEELEAFEIEESVYLHTKKLIETKEVEYKNWGELFLKYKRNYQELYEEFEFWMENNYQLGIEKFNEIKFEKPMATRNISGEILNKIIEDVPNLIGGSADLAPSTKTELKNMGFFSEIDREGNNIHFGVREHGMAAIVNGIYLHGGFRSFGSTFLVFSDYMKGAMRLSALMEIPVIYVLTHDSIGVGEDGPTHQPIEHLAMLRSIPNMVVWRPADGKETIAAWMDAINNKTHPTCIVLSRQNLPQYMETGKEALKGGYVLIESEGKPDLIVMATGSEVEIAYDVVKEYIDKYNIRLVSMPSTNIFELQTKEYKEHILPSNVEKRISIEAASTFGWHKYIGLKGIAIGIDEFGASGPANEVYEKYQITKERLKEEIEKMIKG